MAQAKPRTKQRKEAAAPPFLGDAFAMLFERNPVPLFVYDRSSLRFIAVNSAALELYGYERAAFLEKGIPDILPPEERPLLRGRMTTAADGIVKVGVRRHVSADGAIIHVDLLRQEFELDGSDVALISARDVTRVFRSEQRLQETLERLRRSEERLARAQRVSHTGSVERDLRTGAIVWSEEAYRIFGRPQDWLPPGRGHRPAVLALFHPDDREKYSAVMDASEAGHPSPPLECRVLRPDGTVRWVYHESEVMFDADGIPALRIGTYRDVTEAHEAAAEQARLREALDAAHRELRAVNEDLERRVEQRTDELRAAQEELLKKERLSILGQLTATVAHELRNPLSSIRNTAFALHDASPAIERLVGRIERNVARCDAIIADLLDYTRAHALKQRRVKLDDWLDETLSEQSVPAGISLQRCLEAQEASVMLDGDRFRRVIVNLVDNAAQAMLGHEGERTIRVVTRVAGTAEIEVTDTGPGIPADILPRVFEPLFSTKSFGTGLGLPTVKQIVEQHGGLIQITSVPGAGTTVRIRLPLAETALAA